MMELNTRGKGLFLWLATLALSIMIVLTYLIWLFISPRVNEISVIIAIASYMSLRLFYLVVVAGWLLILLTCLTEKNLLVARFAVRLALKMLLPTTLWLGRILRVEKDAVRASYALVNNAFVKAIKSRFSADKVLLLLPHCLQNSDCGLRITNNIENCRDCGRCDIGAIVAVAREWGIKTAVATGGTLARRIIIQTRPKFIIAVACPRDLVEGMKDVFPIPVYGLLNERPEGPCVNTRLAVPQLKHLLEQTVQKKIESNEVR